MSGQHPAPAGAAPSASGATRAHDHTPGGGNTRTAARKAVVPTPETPPARRNRAFRKTSLDRTRLPAPPGRGR